MQRDSTPKTILQLQSELSRTILSRTSSLSRLEAHLHTLIPVRYKSYIKVGNLKDNTLILFALTPHAALFLETSSQKLLAQLKKKLIKLQSIKIIRASEKDWLHVSKKSTMQRAVPGELTFILDMVRNNQ